ncbi:MAG: DinB family protein [Candidatus Longimicrobiales bacterium M2_2A_002]
MKNVSRILAVLTVALVAPAVTAAQEVDGLRSALLKDLETLEQKYIALAEAVPADQYDWRPAEGIRSIGEVYAHVVAGGYFFSGQFAEGRPADVGIENAPENLDEVTEKDRVVALLRNVFPHIRDAFRSTPVAQLDDEVALFGQTYTVGDVMLLLTTHMHEHLGQSIAYARSVGVAPPWSG